MEELDINFKISDILIVPNISERRTNVTTFKNNLNKIFHFIGNREFFIFCRDTKVTKDVDGKCKIPWYDLSTYQVLEHAKRRRI